MKSIHIIRLRFLNNFLIASISVTAQKPVSFCVHKKQVFHLHLEDAFFYRMYIKLGALGLSQERQNRPSPFR
jgi:hypothetical protein